MKQYLATFYRKYIKNIKQLPKCPPRNSHQEQLKETHLNEEGQMKTLMILSKMTNSWEQIKRIYNLLAKSQISQDTGRASTYQFGHQGGHPNHPELQPPEREYWNKTFFGKFIVNCYFW